MEGLVQAITACVMLALLPLGLWSLVTGRPAPGFLGRPVRVNLAQRSAPWPPPAAVLRQQSLAGVLLSFGMGTAALVLWLFPNHDAILLAVCLPAFACMTASLVVNIRLIRRRWVR